MVSPRYLLVEDNETNETEVDKLLNSKPATPFPFNEKEGIERFSNNDCSSSSASILQYKTNPDTLQTHPRIASMAQLNLQLQCNPEQICENSEGERPSEPSFSASGSEFQFCKICDRANCLRVCTINKAFQIAMTKKEDKNEADSDDQELPLSYNETSVASLREAERNIRNISSGFHPLESLPTAANYENVSDSRRARPTLENLRGDEELAIKTLMQNEGNEKTLKRGRLGWIQGVVLWTIQDLWAVQLFFRLPWLAGQAGMGLYFVIVLINTVIALLTLLSTSAIATNGEIGIGGTYFMIARSLGPSYGAAIGFADIVARLMREHGVHMINDLDDTRIIGVIALVGLTLFTFFGMMVASKFKTVCMIVTVVGILSVIIGSVIPPSLEQQAQGFVGYSSALFRENFVPAFQRDRLGNGDFLTAFAVFFPAISGILAGTSMTGDLKDPSGAIPKGSITATLISSTVYLILGWVSGSVAVRHASGSVDDLLNQNITHCEATMNCSDGFINNMEIMGVISHFRPIIVAATFAVTLSTALGCINFAPKVFQALCRDRIFPGIHIFGKGYGAHDEPYRAYLLTMLISVAFLMPSDLNFISNTVSNCFLMTFALVNYATFHASLSGSVGWRPTFRYYNKWLSLITCIACLAFMISLDWISAIIVFCLAGGLWLFVFYTKPDVNWGTSGHANDYRTAMRDALQLLKIKDHVKNYRPQILVMTGLPCVRPALVYMASSITRATGLMICGHVMVGELVMERTVAEQKIYSWFRNRKIRAFYTYIASKSISEGVRALIQTAGLGKLKPNILMIGYHLNWTKWNKTSMDEYVKIIHDIFDANRALIILCTKEGFDLSDVVDFHQIVSENEKSTDLKLMSVNENESGKTSVTSLELKSVEDPVMMSRIALAEKFSLAKKGRIDGEIHVWWLYDDGGLTILIPHLITRQSPWFGCKLKIFCRIEKGGTHELTKANMSAMLSKFRINVVDVVPVDLDQQPSLESINIFNELLNRNCFMDTSSMQETATNKPIRLTESAIQQLDLVDYGDRTIKQIRLRELLSEHSLDSALNVITMPVPMKNQSSSMYLEVLETMTSGMPPTLLVRGNQENVLTYYC